MKRHVLFVLLALLAVGCQRPVANVAPPQPMRQVTDDLGRTVTVPVKITRVVSTAPSVTENVFAVGAGDRLVGVTTFCNYPEEAKAIEKIGDTMTPNIERIVALKPDVVLVSSASQLQNFTKTLADNGIAVYVTNPESFADLRSEFLKLGEIFGTEEQARNAADELWARELRVCERLGTCTEVDTEASNIRPIPVFVQISKEPLFTIGSVSFLNDVISEAGGKSVTDNIVSAYPKLSKETALALQPDAIIISESPDNQEPNEAFKNSPAVRHGRVYKVSADLLSRPGPRLVDAMEQIARMLHPDKLQNELKTEN